MTTASYDDIMRKTRQLGLSEQLRLLESLAELVRQRVETSKKHSILELEGLGAEVWQGIDAQEYVNQERDSCSAQHTYA